MSVVDGVVTGGTTSANTIIRAAAADLQGAEEGTCVVTNQAYTDKMVGPAGGTLIYDKGSYSNGWRYLELATDKAGSGHGYFNNNNVIQIDGAMDQSMGAGKANTDAIITAIGSGEYLAMDCRNYSQTGASGITYYDWYMPSRQELDKAISLYPPSDLSSSAYTASTQYLGYYLYVYIYNYDGGAFRFPYMGNITWPIRQF